MADEILVSPNELRDHSSRVGATADTVRESLGQLRTQIDGLADSFRGRAAVRFDERYAEWDNGANQILDALQGLGDFLTASADAMESTDEQLASGLGN